MPLDTNIALGVRPIEQPNVLGQMAQAMAIRQAQQGYESENAVKDFYAKGGDLSTAEGRRNLLSRTGFAGSKLIGQQSEINARDVKTGMDSLKMLKENVGVISTPSDMAIYLQNAAKTPGGQMLFGVVPLDKALANIPTDPRAFEAYKRNFGLTADKLYESADARLNANSRIQAAGISAAPANARLAMEQRQQAEVEALMRGEAPSTAPTTVPMTGGGGGGVPNALVQGNVPAPVNMLAPGAQAPAQAPATAGVPAAAPVATAPTGDVYDQIKALDAKIAPLVASGNPRATAIVQQLIAQRNALMQSAKQEYGGQLQDMEVVDPATGQRTTVKGRVDQYGRLVPVELAPAPLSTNAGGSGTTNISPTVARPAPSAAVIKERQVAEKLPEAIAMNTDAIRKIDEMIGGVDAKGKPLEGAKGQPHPGLSKATGLGGGVMRFFSGTEGKNFEIRHKEVLSQAFLDAFEALKGGGAITEKEGEKATAARTRMDLAQSKEEYMTAAREYQGVLKRGVENARARMQRSGTTPPAGAPEDPLGIR